jgi:triacylglycerol lipase
MLTRILAAVLATVIAMPPAHAQSPAPRRDPILFVHGWRGDAAQWRTMMNRFRADGWTDRELYAWTVDPRASNRETARRISARVQQILAATGASRVDIVTHSMGSLSTRYFLKTLHRGDEVDAWVSMGGPNHGTLTAQLCFSVSCREMREGSAFLAELNGEDETPGEVRYATWRSPCDEIIEPVGSVMLDGAENRVTGCVLHLDLIHDPGVYQQVRDFIAP